MLTAESPLTPIQKLIKNSGIYALSAAAPPLVSLVLAPLLTHNLSPTDYGILTILNLCISLGAGISQLGLPSAFFRAYGYDYNASADRCDVIATTTALLCVVSLPMVLGITILSSFFAHLLFGRSTLATMVTLVGIVILLQNLTVPGFAWLRAENRAFSYSLLSIGNLLITLLSNIILVIVLHLGIAGSLMATGCGYISVVVYMLPMTLLRVGIKIRVDIAKNLLSFGLPLVLNFVSYWILQLSDRYLLSIFASLTQTAIYSVAYTLGSALNVIVMGPFTLAWPITMFTIAKREDAAHMFKNVFRWFSLFLLFAAFGLSLLGTALLNWLFPPAYHASAHIIPIIAGSIVFYGIYHIFMVGANIERKTWVAAVFTTIAAIINICLNLVLIPRYGLMGAALSTLIAYIVLAMITYAVNQRIYLIAFEINIFTSALMLGTVLYVGCVLLEQIMGTTVAWVIDLMALCLYGACLAFLAKLPISSWKDRF